ncbi:MAG: carboxypeptidase-like regulatory domain-containing protein [Planctomycetaceae bacterium]|jgi:hypothetical protein|nr:carboxypeptidase-like regulatory domain-containing protein [Planctomycetaceae bacterium]
MTKNKLIFGILFLLLQGLLGCSHAITVKGKVTFSDGTPLEIGKVVFENDQRTFTGKIQKEGTFSMGQLKEGQGIPPGKYRVYISEAFLEEFSPGSPFPKVTQLIAKKYRKPQTSGLEYDIQEKTTDISIVIEKP